jgi:hypothetical protein
MVKHRGDATYPQNQRKLDMTVRVTTDNSTDAQELMSFAAAAREAEAKAAAEKPVSVPVHIPGRHAVTFQNGVMTERSSFSGRATLSPRMDPGRVVLKDGTETTLEAAKAAGLTDMIVATADDVPFKSGSEPAQAKAPTETKGNPEQGSALSDVTAGEAAQINGAAELISQANDAIGATAVNAIQADVVSTGELPRELPSGITPEMVDSISKGYVAQANAILRSTGANVDTLMEFLSDDELKAARVAAFKGDDARLKDLGSVAVERLRKLPDDPGEFEKLVSILPPEVKLSQRNGHAWVDTPDFNMSWRDAVDAGYIRF